MPYMVVIWEDVLVVEWLGQILSAYPGVLLEETVDDWPDVMDFLMSDTTSATHSLWLSCLGRMPLLG